MINSSDVADATTGSAGWLSTAAVLSISYGRKSSPKENISHRKVIG
jgi:hypothetical protein